MNGRTGRDMWKNPEMKRKYFELYYEIHAEEIKQKRKEYYKNHKEAERRANNERYRKKCLNDISTV